MGVTDLDVATAEAVEDETLTERRLRFLSMRNAGGTFDAIAARWNKQQIDAAIAAGRDPSTVRQLSATTVRKDVEKAKLEIVGKATREGMIAETYSVLLDMRRAHYAAALGGDIDATKMVLATTQQQRDLFGLDSPKRAVVGVGTDVEFAEQMFALMQGLGSDAAKELAAIASTERDLNIVDAEVEDEPDHDPSWSNLADG